MRDRHTEKNQTPQRNSSLVSLFIACIFLALSGILIVNSIKTLSMATSREKLLARAQSDVQQLRLRNLMLQEDLDEVMSLGYVEREARNRLYYARPGEYVVVLPDEIYRKDKPGGEAGQAGDAVVSGDAVEAGGAGGTRAVAGESAVGQGPDDVDSQGEGDKPKSGWLRWWDFLREGV